VQAALIPVRALNDAKRRLAASLAPHEREQLAVAMLADMLDALLAARTLERVYVVSSDHAVLECAAHMGATPLREEHPAGLNAAVAWAAALLEQGKVRRLLTIPGDVPLLDTKEVERLLATDPKLYPVVLVPSASGSGTNALLTSPPSVIPPCFEGQSLAAHTAACASKGIVPRVLPLAGFALDIDTPEDLVSLSRHAGPQRSARLNGASGTRAATSTAAILSR
jgi:2-phospho-L-lactate guanylyltransferase